MNYNSIHDYNRRNFPKKGICVDCKNERKTEYSLIKGKKHSKGLTNYKERCVPCHRAYDSGYVIMDRTKAIRMVIRFMKNELKLSNEKIAFILSLGVTKEGVRKILLAPKSKAKK